MKRLRSFLTRYKKINLFIIIIFMAACSVTLLGRKHQLEMFTFPFIVEIWGTVADWAMVIVTILTAWFLWKTLKSQTEVQITQNKLTKLEFERYRRDILPKFSLKSHSNNFNDEKNKNLKTRFYLKLDSNQAFNVNVSYKVKNFEVDAFEINSNEFMNTTELILIQGETKIPDLYEKNTIISSVTFNIAYKDKLNNSYKQTAIYAYYGDLNERDYSYEPILQTLIDF